MGQTAPNFAARRVILTLQAVQKVGAHGLKGFTTESLKHGHSVQAIPPRRQHGVTGRAIESQLLVLDDPGLVHIEACVLEVPRQLPAHAKVVARLTDRIFGVGIQQSSGPRRQRCVPEEVVHLDHQDPAARPHPQRPALQNCRKVRKVCRSKAAPDAVCTGGKVRQAPQVSHAKCAFWQWANLRFFNQDGTVVNANHSCTALCKHRCLLSHAAAQVQNGLPAQIYQRGHRTGEVPPGGLAAVFVSE